MTQRDDLLGRLKELHTGTKAHRATSRVIRAMIFDGDYASATTALDTLEDALHPALAAGGGGPLVGCLVYKSGAQVINDAVNTDITLDTVGPYAYDPHGFLDLGTGIITIPQAFGGWYSMVLWVVFPSTNAVGYREVSFENSQGFNTPSTAVPAIAAAAAITVPHVAPLSFEEDDYIIPRARQTSGGPMTITEAVVSLVRLGDYG